ncbi:protein-glutamate O-methyltransferase CheR [Rhodoferax sp. AJA081-3]|uniref:CheR family methyltransferase n=1 Tax=Rhodoferax sp. AJA081-3 TaxID=2752316 RepID=UPI001ADEEBA8|nr:protein-glutamate O-methyltransferase CheR [Rhodoferax sp. AJA081-3]QTN28968.1 protein-glutamate O-methyltransferase CheR [Rhodoferax sp. AJA081-3]
MIDIKDHEFAKYQSFIFDEAGITLASTKKALVTGRLSKRLQHHGLSTYTEYLSLLSSKRDPAEVQIAIDLLTTNETYFFREPKHFDLLRKLVMEAAAANRPLRVWSAACSSGEEVYSIAMVLADCMENRPWELFGSDISARVLRHASFGHYPEGRTTHIPPDYLKRFCLKGTGPQAGTLLIQRSLRDRVRFMQVNLDRPLPNLGQFDLIFVRNVMIYFSSETKQGVAQRLAQHLKPGGHLLVGHSETLNDTRTDLRPVAPSIYTKP